MEKLRDKTFYTIFFIISSFIFSAILFLNIQSYQKEYRGLVNNLNRMNNILSSIKRPNKQDFTLTDLYNRIIMDYNFYTIILDKNNNIVGKVSHNENILSEDIINKANSIISNKKDSEIKVGSLYLDKLSYNFNSGNFLIFVDTSNIQKRLVSLLLVTSIIFILFEILVYFISRMITDWITKPVLESFNKQKEFIVNASHELKTPLSVMIASIDCIDINKKNKKWIDNLKSESDRMNNLITRLLDLSKFENNTNKEIYNINNLSKIVENRVLTFESLAFENKVLIETSIQKNIMFKCNQNDMHELVSIIVDNAIKHSYSNSKIKVNLYKEKNNIILDIINNGKEIPEEECDKIFERFYRSDKSRNRDSNRYGLGLSIAKNIVNNHEGKIIAFSKNKLTTFRVILKDKKH